MTVQLSITVFGLPQAQGGVRPVTIAHGARAGKTALISTGGKDLRPWRKKITDVATLAANSSHHKPSLGPVRVDIRFFLAAANDRARRYPHGIGWRPMKPDIDKLTRAVHDSLRDGGWYHDDAQVVESRHLKYEVSDRALCGIEVVMYELGDLPEDAIKAVARRRALNYTR